MLKHKLRKWYIKFLTRIMWRLPHSLIYFASVHMLARITTEDHPDKKPDDFGAMDVLRIYEAKHLGENW